nr:PREDICTED: probable serine/threonine-protein kinase nek3 [Linepithema humile]
MRVLPSIILCLFMALCVLANDDSANDNSASDNSASDNSASDDSANNDFVLGERKENDDLIYTKQYLRLSPFHPATITIPVTLRKNKVITQVKLNIKRNKATVTVLKGEIGERFLALRVEAQSRGILAVSVKVYGSDAQTTPSPTTPNPTTPNPTTPNPTTPNPTTPNPTTPNPTTPNPTTPSPTTVADASDNEENE